MALDRRDTTYSAPFPERFKRARDDSKRTARADTAAKASCDAWEVLHRTPTQGVK
jgi:hypothetical protein